MMERIIKSRLLYRKGIEIHQYRILIVYCRYLIVSVNTRRNEPEERKSIIRK